MTAPPRVLIMLRGRLGAYAEPLPDHAHQGLAAMAQAAGLGPDHELSLVLCDNVVMRQLNRRWRNIDRPTDVLSFPLHELRAGDTPPGGALGDIVVSVPVVRVAARAEGVALTDHLDWLLAHGLLHLLGHDHPTEAARRRMDAEARRLLGRN